MIIEKAKEKIEMKCNIETKTLSCSEKMILVIIIIKKIIIMIMWCVCVCGWIFIHSLHDMNV